jgi:hypothetical protein
MELESDDFAPESATSSRGARAVTVGAVLAAATPLHWDEAVAIFQELVDVLTSSNRDDIPAFDDVLIDADGRLTIRGTRRLERGPLAAGRALHTLLATTDVPVALRLFVTQANVPETHHSLAAFGKGLAYFGKPDRAELIRAIYARYKPAAATASVPPNGAPTPQPPRTPPPSRPAERLNSRGTLRRGLVAAAIIACLASGGAVGWLLFTHAPRPASNATPQAKSASPASTAQPAKQTADSSASRVTKEKAVSLRPQGTPSRPASIVGAERRDGIRAEFDPTLVLPRTESARTSSPVDVLARDTLPPPATVATREAGGARALVAIYSGDDRDVQPPSMLSPQLPPPLMIGGPSDGRVNRMELVVATDGSVERVRLIGAPRRMADMMLLSGAKLWKFTPAIKDGVPVRYRTMVSWMVFP